jgi:hypothetical protein
MLALINLNNDTKYVNSTVLFANYQAALTLGRAYDLQLTNADAVAWFEKYENERADYTTRLRECTRLFAVASVIASLKASNIPRVVSIMNNVPAATIPVAALEMLAIHQPRYNRDILISLRLLELLD